jgi:hypothetical protein
MLGARFGGEPLRFQLAGQLERAAPWRHELRRGALPSAVPDGIGYDSGP